MRSKFSIMGHPLHPLLVALPIGLFVWAFASDIIYLATSHDHMWYAISFWTGIAAIVTALLAALPGFGDFFTMAIHTDARVPGTAHMLLNLGIVALYIIAAIMQSGDKAVAGGMLTGVFIIHLVGVGLLLLSGWLGGEMVFRHHMAMVPDDSEAEQVEQRHHELGGQHIV
jgi:uncharacterized membrane protein